MLSSFTTATPPFATMGQPAASGEPVGLIGTLPVDPSAPAGESVVAFAAMLAGLQPAAVPAKLAAPVMPLNESVPEEDSAKSSPVFFWHVGRGRGEIAEEEPQEELALVEPEVTRHEKDSKEGRPTPEASPSTPMISVVTLPVVPEPPAAEAGLPASKVPVAVSDAITGMAGEKEGKPVVALSPETVAAPVSELLSPLIEPKPVAREKKESGAPAQAAPAQANASSSPMATPAPMPAAQFAALHTPPAEEAGQFSGLKNKNTRQDIDKQVETNVKAEGGTDHANEAVRMFTLAPSTAVMTAEISSGGIPRLASEAARMVERVARTAEMIAAQPAEKVQVRIELSDIGVVDVSVALREGVVHTSFRSDSPEVREALAAAWNDFTKGREAARHNWADPVFAKIEPAPVAASTGTPSDGRDLGQTFGQGASSRQQEQPGDERGGRFVPAHPSLASASPTASAVATQAHVPARDSSRLLHVLA